jgi:hypothetical protein
MPLALRGLWGSFFSRAANGRAMRRWRGVYSRIALVAGPALAPGAASSDALHATVLGLRGERR